MTEAEHKATYISSLTERITALEAENAALKAQVAADVQTGRNFIGIEIDPGYFAIAQRRIAEAQMQPRLPLETEPQAEQGALL